MKLLILSMSRFLNHALSRILFLMLFSGIVLVGCRGSDGTDINDPQFPVTNDPDAFGLFLNQSPGVPKGGAVSGEIDNVQNFPEAYYNTIDPDKTRDTFDKWREANGFINADGTEAACDPASCRQTHVKFRDFKDLGYGRNMFLRWNTATSDVAVYVENFQVDAVPGFPYGPLNLEALINNDRQWNFGVNAIEFSAFPATDINARKFTKFYNFAGDGIKANATSGTQHVFVDLDNRGPKPMPTACIICHGGRGETLVIKDSDGTRTLAPTLVDGIPGDVQAHLQTIEFDTLKFSSEPGFTREDNEAGIQLINEAILSTYVYRQLNFTGSGDWSADLAIKTLEGRYAGDPGNPANRYNADFIPTGWSSDQNLYRQLMAPNCLVCHALRGTQVNPSIAFPTLDDLKNYSPRIDHLIYEQGKMPLGLLNYSNFWDSTDKDPAIMATTLGLADRVDANNRAVRPGAPVALIAAPPEATGIDAGGASLDIAITGSGSAFAASGGYRWQVDSDTATVTPVIGTAGAAGEAVLRVSAAGSYTLTLTIAGIHGGSDSTAQTVRVLAASDAGAPLAGADINYFGDGGINDLLTEKCLSCHVPSLDYSSMPIYYIPCRSDDFNGNEFLYRSVLARVNFNSPLDSLFLRKPSNGSTGPVDLTRIEIQDYHKGAFALDNEGADYSKILSWILNGAPSGTIPADSTIAADAPSCTTTQ